MEEVSKMTFAPALIDYLNKYQLIYTIRKYKMDDNLVDIKPLGIYKREYIGKVKDYDLKELNRISTWSGFTTWNNWSWAVYRVNGTLTCIDNMYIYKIEKYQEYKLDADLVKEIEKYMGDKTSAT